MSTTTIAPGVLTGSADSGAKAQLLKSFWLKLKAAPTVAFATAKGYTASAVSAIPAPFGALAVPVALSTRWGYNLFGKAVGLVVRTAGRLIRGAARLVHHGIDVVGDLVCNAVGVFSGSYAAKLGDSLASFGEARLSTGQSIANLAGAVYGFFSGAYNRPRTRGVLMITAQFVAIVTLLGAFAPVTFAAMLAYLPLGAQFWISGIAHSSTLGLQLMVRVFGVMTVLYALRNIGLGLVDWIDEYEETHPEPVIVTEPAKSTPGAQMAGVVLEHVAETAAAKDAAKAAAANGEPDKAEVTAQLAEQERAENDASRPKEGHARPKSGKRH